MKSEKTEVAKAFLSKTNKAQNIYLISKYTTRLQQPRQQGTAVT